MSTTVSISGALAAVLTAAATFGCGTAHASPTVVGQKYSDASSALSSAGFAPVVSTTVGDQLPWASCVVVHQQDRQAQAPPNSGGSGTKQVLVSLNCDAALASATKAGNSLASLRGRAEKAAQDQQAAQQAAAQ